MMHFRTITGTRRNYLVALPADYCRRQHIRPGHSIILQVRLGDQMVPFPARVVAHARGLKVTIPRPWRVSEGLTSGDPVVLLEAEPGALELQTVAGATEKELHRRGEVVMLMRIAKARAEVEAARDNAFREGYWRRALEDMFSPGRPPITCPPRGSRGRQ